MKKRLGLLLPLVLFLLMLRFPSAVFQGARTGLLLWFRQVLPALFPFMVLCEILLGTNSIRWVTGLVSPVLSPLLGISRPACFAVLGGFLCGYPMGARITASLEEKGAISEEEGLRLLSFVNNVSPAFLMTFVVQEHLKDSRLLVPGLAAVFGAPLLLGFLLGKKRGGHVSEKKDRMLPEGAGDSFFQALDRGVCVSLEAVARVGGYIILFSVAAELLKLVPLDSFSWSCIVLPSLEISGGIHMLSVNPSLTAPVRAALVMGLTSFGGFCAAFQTMDMMQGHPFSLGDYLIKKLVTAVVTSFLIFLML